MCCRDGGVVMAAALASGRWTRRIILNFHGIGTPPPGVPVAEHPFWCSRDEWPGIIDAISTAIATTSGSGTSVEITFDDGNVSDVEAALPVLLEHGLTATFHVCAGRIGLPGYLDGQGLQQLQDGGMRIGSHGWHHVDLRTVSDAQLVQETRDSQDLITEVCGTPVPDFAVPFGSYDRRVLRHLKDYATVYTSDGTTAARQAWLVPRWSYVRTWTPDFVRDLLQHGEPPGHRLRQGAAMLVKRFR